MKLITFLLFIGFLALINAQSAGIEDRVVRNPNLRTKTCRGKAVNGVQNANIKIAECDVPRGAIISHFSFSWSGEGHDQGWATGGGSWTWVEATDCKGGHRTRLWTNRRANRHFFAYRGTIAGNHALARRIQGEVNAKRRGAVCAYARSLFPGWRVYVRNFQITIHYTLRANCKNLGWHSAPKNRNAAVYKLRCPQGMRLARTVGEANKCLGNGDKTMLARSRKLTRANGIRAGLVQHLNRLASQFPRIDGRNQCKGDCRWNWKWNRHCRINTDHGYACGDYAQLFVCVRRGAFRGDVWTHQFGGNGGGVCVQPYTGAKRITAVTGASGGCGHLDVIKVSNRDDYRMTHYHRHGNNKHCQTKKCKGPRKCVRRTRRVCNCYGRYGRTYRCKSYVTQAYTHCYYPQVPCQKKCTTLKLGPHEFINGYHVWFGKYVDGVKLTTNQGRSWFCGNAKGHVRAGTYKYHKLTDMRNRCGWWMDALKFHFKALGGN